MIAGIKYMYLQKNSLKAIAMLSLIALLVFSACSKPNPPQLEVAKKDLELIQSLPEKTSEFLKNVKSTLERRCIVCHGCYDAPCQLKLSSLEGIERGANKLKVYNKKRFTYQQPTRLFIDANSTEQWREKKFFSVLNEGESQLPEDNLKNSLLYQMLNLKQRNPLPESGKLPGNPGDSGFLDVSIDREQVCTTLDTFNDFASKHKNWGMPFALPNLSAEESEYKLLVQWLAHGAPEFEKAESSLETVAQIKRWEVFFNGSSNKQKLVSRYIYEHLVLGHIHFKGSSDREFFRLVRARNQSGEMINEIPSVRPYDDPEGDFYYRLRPYAASIVEKNHIVYEFSDVRMQRYRELFLQPDYEVKVLPAYNPGEASGRYERFFIKVKKLLGLYEQKMLTPFKIFDDIPPQSRYQFLLDDARFFINGFIKGPVCRGLSALSSIEDHFWVFFLKAENPPDYPQHGLDKEFLKKNDNLLHLPTELADTNRLFTAWLKYWPKEQEYMQAKLGYYQTLNNGKGLPQLPIRQALDEFIWDGTRNGGMPDKNAALTIFRHLDSASVHYGLHGDEPETAWIIDYPVFERLHYLLVAGYNTFGTLGHQASARLYMDFLRMEGEDNFLFFLPVEKRKELYTQWHNVDRSSTRKQNHKTSAWLDEELVSGYLMKDQQHELYKLLRDHIAFKSADSADMNRCSEKNCFDLASDRTMQRLANLSGKSSEFMPLQYFSSLSYIRVGGKDGVAYTLIYNKSYQRYEKDSFTKDVKNRSKTDMRGDTLTVLKGLAGSYPNFFFDVKSEDLEAFVTACENLRSKKDYSRLVEQFGIRRTNPAFWKVADWFQERHAYAQPVESGILDLSRYRDL
jgi:hypothetical protein